MVWLRATTHHGCDGPTEPGHGRRRLHFATTDTVALYCTHMLNAAKKISTGVAKRRRQYSLEQRVKVSLNRGDP